MPTHVKICATLARMERARAETARRLDIIERQIAARPEQMGITFRQFGRGEGTPIEAFGWRPRSDQGAMSQSNATFPVDRGVGWGENLAVQSQASPTRRKAVGGNKGGGL